MFEWIAERSLQGALNWSNAMQAALGRLRTNPLGCARAEEADDISEYDLRQILFKTSRGRTYRIVFIVAGNQVHVLRIRGPGQAPLTDGDL
jgi:hypothetical protein